MNLTSIPDYPGYAFDDTGELWSNKRGRWKVRKYAIGSGGYYHATLMRDNRPRCKKLHHWIALAFCGPRPVDHEAAHSDGNKLNNHPSNITWKTHWENMQDKRTHGTIVRGERNPLAKLTEADVVSIRLAHANGTTQKTLSRHYAVTQAAISLIVRRKNWAHVAG